VKSFALALALAAALGMTGCSAGTATNNVATMDTAAKKACAQLRQVAHDRPSLSPRDLREQIGQINSDAEASSNPIVRARAVALYTDATLMVEGGEPGSFNADLAAFEKACQPSG
jgi:hypothetical protein